MSWSENMRNQLSRIAWKLSMIARATRKRMFIVAGMTVLTLLATYCCLVVDVYVCYHNSLTHSGHKNRG